MTGGDGAAQLVGCSVCGGRVAASAYACPHCGAPQPALEREREAFKWLFAQVVMYFALIGGIAAMPVHLPGMVYFASAMALALWVGLTVALSKAGFGKYLRRFRPPVK